MERSGEETAMDPLAWPAHCCSGGLTRPDRCQPARQTALFLPAVSPPQVESTRSARASFLSCSCFICLFVPVPFLRFNSCPTLEAAMGLAYPAGAATFALLVIGGCMSPLTIPVTLS
jgi:hypothetical protein